MKVEFLHPIGLLLFLPIAVFCIWQAKKGMFASAFRRKLYTGIRLLVCLLLVLCMAGMQIYWQSDMTATVFALDVSASVAEDGKAAAFLDAAQDAAGQKDETGLIVFGQNASVEKTVSDTPLPQSGFVSYVSKDGTDIAGALQLAAANLQKKRRSALCF